MGLFFSCSWTVGTATGYTTVCLLAPLERNLLFFNKKYWLNSFVSNLIGHAVFPLKQF